MGDSRIEEYHGKRVVVRVQAERCIHSRNCVLGRPDVFVPNKPGEWVYPDGANVEHVCAVTGSCPSGALTYERLDGGPQEEAPLVNVIRIRETGPNAVNADLTITGHGKMLRATLCRCGASKNKPFCDNSHVAAGFTATGEPALRETAALTVRNGVLSIEPTLNGPNHVVGNLEICTGTGHTMSRVTETWLCRCGHSKDKPFCDGTHAKVGFQADGVED